MREMIVGNRNQILETHANAAEKNSVISVKFGSTLNILEGKNCFIPLLLIQILAKMVMIKFFGFFINKY